MGSLLANTIKSVLLEIYKLYIKLFGWALMEWMRGADGGISCSKSKPRLVTIYIHNYVIRMISTNRHQGDECYTAPISG